jgi:putative Ca2+/H+ antiporter (TMEM165/GDT1 family)
VLYIFFLSYGLVFVAEIAGDKLLYVAGTLATRYRRAPILAGFSIAFMLKMLAAVLFGAALTRLHPRAVTAISAITFAAIALAIWLEPRADASSPRAGADVSGARAMAASFAAVFFSEWGDIGQITAATLSTRFAAPAAVWAAATLAMMTKAALAITVGGTLRKRVPQGVLRWCGALLLLCMGASTVLELIR